jgi:hypothetical protein
MKYNKIIKIILRSLFLDIDELNFFLSAPNNSTIENSECGDNSVLRKEGDGYN